MLNKVKYACKNCGWETSIRAEWSDLKPKRCMNKKCNASFLKNPKDLIITPPVKKDKVKSVSKEDKQNDKKQTSNKSKAVRKTVKQHDKSEEEKQKDS